jgi:hypothetical protein
LAERSQFSPDFQGARSRLYRSEYAVITVAILAFLVWRYLYAGGGINILEIVFWAIFPDLAAFIPIGVASKKGVWPAWGASLYDFFHTILVWTAIFAVTWIILKTPHWELLGWLGHISTDRAVGYGLRETRKPVTAQSTPSIG